MFAGKSSELLRRVQALEVTGSSGNSTCPSPQAVQMNSDAAAVQAADKQILLVKSDRDTRYSKDEITTHDGLARPCHAVGLLAELRAATDYANAQVIAIDEAQFFPDLLEFCTEASDHEHKQILVAGLDGDFRRHRFGQVIALTCMVP